MALDLSAVASGIIDKAEGGLVTPQGSAVLDGWYEVADRALSARVSVKGQAVLSGTPTLTTPTVLTIAVLGDSAADADNEWVRRLVDLWVDRYGDWFHYVSLADPSGQTHGWDGDGFVNTAALSTPTRVVSVWNPSFGGAGYDDYTQADIDDYVVATGADIVIMAQGINMANDGSTIEPEFTEVEGWILAGLPDAQFVASSENPVVSHGGSPDIRDAVRAVAASRGYPFVDIYQAFVNYGDWESLLADGVHPNAQGSQLWADYFNAATYLTATGELVGTGDMTATCSTSTPTAACSTSTPALACTISA